MIHAEDFSGDEDEILALDHLTDKGQAAIASNEDGAAQRAGEGQVRDVAPESREEQPPERALDALAAVEAVR